MDAEVPKVKLPWWAIPAGVVLLLVLVAQFTAGQQLLPPAGSTYDAAPGGARAAFLLLQGLGYDVAASRRLTEGNVRWVIAPHGSLREADGLAEWVRDGGRLLLADTGTELAERLGLTVEAAAAGDLTLQTERGPLRVSGGAAMAARDRPDRTWPAQGEALADIFRRGRGEVWLLRRPEFLRNDHLRSADNAVVLCLLADATAEGRRLYFDEFFHGLRDRPGVVELLLRPPALWVTLQGVVLLAVALARYVPRFGALRVPPPVRRRSKEEFLDAMAYLMERKKAYEAAHRSLRDALARELEHALGLPPGVPTSELAAAAARRVPSLDAGRLARALAADRAPRGAAAFVAAARELADLRGAFFGDANSIEPADLTAARPGGPGRRLNDHPEAP